MQLKAIIFQKPSEERVDWKSDASYQIEDEAHSLPPRTDWGSPPPESHHCRKPALLEQGPDPREEEIPAFATLLVDYESESTFPIRFS